MILAIKTDNPNAEVILVNNDGTIASTHSWLAHRTLAKELPGVIRQQLEQTSSDWSALSAVIMFSGPGSFTGLRIGAAVANTLAYAQNIPIVGSSGEEWVQNGVSRLKSGQNDQLVMPAYGSEANITKPKK